MEMLKKLPSSGDKGNPPLPPLTGGQEKTKAPLPAAGVAFLYPPVKGGRGGLVFEAKEDEEASEA